MRFETHYTLAEARALLPKVRKWLKRLVDLRSDLEKYDKRLAALMVPGRDLGGQVVNAWVKALAEIKSVLMEFERRDIQIKDLDRDSSISRPLSARKRSSCVGNRKKTTSSSGTTWTRVMGVVKGSEQTSFSRENSVEPQNRKKLKRLKRGKLK